MTKTESKLIEIEIELGNKMTKRYNNFLSMVNGDIEKNGLSIIGSGSEVKAFRKRINKLMNKAGLNQFSSELAPFLSNIESVALDELSKDLGELLSLDNPKLRGKYLSKTDRMNTKIFNDQKKFFSKKMTLKGAKGITSKTALKSYVKSLTKGTRSRLKTLTQTSVQVYDNISVTQKANELGLNKFKYAGAKDSRNRPFCSDRVKKIFTDAESKKWDNGQLAPASETLGGYNCRHRKRYIREDI